MTLRNDPSLVETSTQAGVLTITLGAPPAHALSAAMIEALHATILDAAEDTEVGAILIHGPGAIFCGGHDLKEIKHHRSDGDQGRDYLAKLFADCADLMQTITLSPKPTIAVVEGVATAGGLQLVASCDLAFAGPKARFCLPGVNNSGFCSTPAVAVSRNLSRKHVMEMALSGEMFDADWALAAGLINRILPEDDLLPFAQGFAEKIAQRHAPAIALGKQTLYRQLELPMSEAYDQARDAMLEHFMDPTRIRRDLLR